MSALGDLILVLLLGFLLIPPLVMLPRIIRDWNSNKRRNHLKWFMILSMPFILVYGMDKISEIKEGLERKGTYFLTDYPKCPTCVLELKSTFRYEVRKGKSIVEKGKWKYKSGGDYWITYIGKYDQLGTGKFKYKSKKESIK